MTHQIENPNSWYLKDRAAFDHDGGTLCIFKQEG